MTVKNSSTPTGVPIFERDAKGKIPASRSNMLAAVSDPNVCGYRFRRDEWCPEILMTQVPRGESRYFSHADLYSICMRLEEFGFHYIRNGLLEQAIRSYVFRDGGKS